LGQSQQKLSILIVEDVDEMRELLRMLLEPIEGVKVTGVAKNGFQARMEVSKNRPDLVLLDEILPGESSYDLLEEWALLHIPVILITGFFEADRPVPPFALGRLEKPGWDTLEMDRERIKKYIFDRMRRTPA
jgi:CheY-like chemotaxis protein